MSNIHNIKEEIFILVHSFTGFSPWFSGSWQKWDGRTAHWGRDVYHVEAKKQRGQGEARRIQPSGHFPSGPRLLTRLRP